MRRPESRGTPDLLVDVLEPVVQGEDLCGDVRDDAGGDVLARQRGVPSSRTLTFAFAVR